MTKKIVKVFVLCAFGIALLICCLCACGAEKASSADVSEKEQVSVSAENEESQIEELESQQEGPETEDNSIEFETPLVAWEDDKVKIEIIGFFQETYYWDEDPTTESGVTFKYTNKTDAEFQVWLDDAYIGTDGVYIMRSGGDGNVAPGKSTTSNYIFQKYVGSKEVALDSIDELYELDGKFLSYSSDNRFEQYDMSFSIPELMNGGESSTGDAAGQTTATSSLYGTWEVVEVLTTSGQNLTVAEMEANGMYSWSDWNIVVAETGDIYLQTNNTSNKGTAVVDSTGITAGKNQWVLSDNRLVLNSKGTEMYYEKVSDDQVVPEPEKKDLVEMLEGVWEINSSSRTGIFSFSGTSATAIINGVAFTPDTLCVITKENRIRISETVLDNFVSMDLYYTYENGVLSLTYDGDTLTKQ